MTRGELRGRLALVVVADDRPERQLVEVAVEVVEAGAPALQLRRKGAEGKELFRLARRLLQVTRPRGALLFVNDRLDVALAAGADGAHLGADDLPLEAARRLSPAGFLLGRSVDTPAEARAAALAGADYLGVGPVFATGSKSGLPGPAGTAGVREVVRAVKVPVIGIGGITVERAGAVITSGAAGVAVISAVMGAASPGAAVEAFLRSLSTAR
ncbi:MAG: thiamine phosphate synthase [Longimicrobiaceae bacterium]